jgi:hypothetical protein
METSGVEFYPITNEWIIIRFLDRYLREKHMRSFVSLVV